MFSEHADFHFPHIFKTVFSIESISRFVGNEHDIAGGIRMLCKPGIKVLHDHMANALALVLFGHHDIRHRKRDSAITDDPAQTNEAFAIVYADHMERVLQGLPGLGQRLWSPDF